ncbi:uncharacterized protein LOC111879650 [Lactuca sativa]|uniref:uncharacterized protein LOC111879650 n=1 Tax=Lactuca sativa TaxID=4236 RepID=UPI0022AE907A|nr:uncharacterized protein LOC111879650 [Lactuca sativa]
MTKVDKYAKGLPWEYVVLVRQTPTLEAAIWSAKSVEEMIKGRASSKVKVGEKRQFEGSSKSNKKNKSGSKKYGGGGNEAKWCEKCKKKHSEKCSEEVTCYKCGRTEHYANECTSNKKVCYGCNEEEHIAKDLPKNKEAARPIVPPNPKAKAFQMTLEAAKEAADVASALPIEKLDDALIVEVASGKFIHVSNCIRNIVINKNVNEFHDELLPIELNSFDIVLGMDLLSTNDAEIPCKKKIVRANPPGKETFVVYKDKRRFL